VGARRGAQKRAALTLREALAEGQGRIGASRPGSPFLDASLLLAWALGSTRDRLLASLPEPVPASVLARYRALVERRASGEAVAYITGRKEFLGRDFIVDRRVLVPRPDTEILVETALAGLPAPGAAPIRIHDAYCGSGCVGISLALARPDADLSLSDLDPGARDVCAANCLALLGRVPPILASDALSGVDGPFDLITANPPYVRSDLTLSILGKGSVEPRLALDGGPDGLAQYGALAGQAMLRLAPGGVLAVEIGDEQAADVARLFDTAGFAQVRTTRDLAGYDRVVTGRRP